MCKILEAKLVDGNIERMEMLMELDADEVTTLVTTMLVTLRTVEENPQQVVQYMKRKWPLATEEYVVKVLEGMIGITSSILEAQQQILQHAVEGKKPEGMTLQ